ncbi:SET and MYND domain-containing protein 4 [Gastrophryne carolinensis]
MELPVLEWQEHVFSKWSQLSPCEKAKFSASSDLKESFTACWSQLQQEDEELLERLCCDLSVGKEPGAVMFYKEEGNKRFGRKQYTAAAVLYSKAISHASPGTEEMAICFANRSAVLFHLGHYSVCLEDIDRAEEHGYPERLKRKILQRHAECLQKLKQSSSSSTPRTRSINLMDATGEPAADAVCDKLQELNLNKNLQLTNASSSLNIQFSTSKGRHLVASEDISQGELLILEEALVSVIIPDRKPMSSKSTWDINIANFDLYCHHCLQRTLATLPCQQCSFARYCSVMCMDKAWKDYHHAECSIGGLLLAFGVFCHTSLRAILLTGYKQVSQVFNQSWGAGLESIWRASADELYRSNYKSLFNLCSHSEHHRQEHKYLCGLTVAALCKTLSSGPLKTSREASALNKETENGPLDVHVIGSVLLLHMLQLHCNAQAVTVLQQQHDESDRSLVESSKCVRLATAIFPILSLMNHSCEPNTSVSFQGRQAMVRACQAIRKGEEVLHCYGPQRIRKSLEERQMLLKDQYFFVCCCKACTEEGTLTAKAPCDFCCAQCHAALEGEKELHCVGESCSYAVRRPQLELRLQQLQHVVHRAQQQLQDGHPGDSSLTITAHISVNWPEKLIALFHTSDRDVAISMLASSLSEASEFLFDNHVLYGEIFDQLAQAEVSKGDWATAAGHLRRSIQLVEQRYGASSLELGQEMFKLAQILFNGCRVTEAMSTIVKAQHILSLHYGPEHCLVQELQEMKTCLLDLPGMN